MSVIGRIGQSLLERREHISSESALAWLKGGYDTYAGEDVSPGTSIGLTAVWACVKVLAETVGSLPLILYRRLPNGGKERATKHPLYKVLHDRANREMDSLTWRETAMGHLATWGNAYHEIEWTQGGQVAGLWLLRPDRTKVSRVNGELVYTYQRNTADAQGRTVATLRPENVLHIHGLGFDGLTGYSPIQQLRNALGLTQATERYGSAFFKNGARPGGVIKYPKTLSDEAFNRLRESWDNQHQGAEKASRVAVLEEGMEYMQVGLPPEDSQFLETRKFQIAEIARIYRVPPHMIADLDKATFSNIEHQSLEFVIHTIRPWLVKWEQGLNAALLSESEREQYFIEFLVDGLLRGDLKARYEAYAVARTNGWMNVNEIRGLENMNPVEGGETFLVPLNMAPANQVRTLTLPQPLPDREGSVEARYGAVLNRSNKEDLEEARDLVDGVIKRAEPAKEEDERQALKAGARV
ncbi:MAG TPA: phage portal protein, partial [Anaerolineaceae bacterium]|nr:phage portal protein [Anaerolineaceae bacterium]